MWCDIMLISILVEICQFMTTWGGSFQNQCIKTPILGFSLKWAGIQARRWMFLGWGCDPLEEPQWVVEYECLLFDTANGWKGTQHSHISVRNHIGVAFKSYFGFLNVANWLFAELLKCWVFRYQNI